MTSLLTPLTLVQLLDDVPEPDEVTPGWIYFVVFMGLLLATVLLWLSMRRQLKKVRFEEPPATDTDLADKPPTT